MPLECGRNGNGTVTDELQARLDALEMRIAHQDRAIADLNDVIVGHWRKIAALERHIGLLREELQNIAPAREGREPPPPHY